MTVYTPAKINILLDIGAKDASGFHELHSLFQMVDLCDTLTVTFMEEDPSITVTSEPFELPAQNTLTRGWELFCKEIGRSIGCRVHIRKQIPPGAGLGGGSSNAAGLLRLLNDWTGRPVGELRLQELARSIGSDVPFFLGTSAAWVEGTGEVLVPVAPRVLSGVLVKPEFEIATPWAYSALDESRGQGASSWSMETRRADCIDAYAHQVPSAWKFFNSFDSVLERRYPELLGIRRLLENVGAGCFFISGSGSTVCGLFDTPDVVSLCEKKLKKRAYWRQCVKTLAKTPIGVYNTL